MLYLGKKMLRDLWNMKVQFIAVFLLAFASLFVYTGMEGIWYGMEKVSKEWSVESNQGDVWIKGHHIDENDIKSLENLPDINTAQGVVNLEATMNYGDGSATLFLMSSSENEISRPFIVAGEDYDPKSPDLWINDDFARVHSIEPEDKLSLAYKDGVHDFVVKGIILSPEHISFTGSSINLLPDHRNYGYAYTNILDGDPVYYDGLRLRLSDSLDLADGVSERQDYEGDHMGSLEKKIEKELGDKFFGLIDPQDHLGIAPFREKFRQIKSMTLLFSFVLILLAFMTIQTTMIRMVAFQRSQIATLKALGYGNGLIYFHYVSFGFLLSLLGGILGYYTGPLGLGRILLNMQKSFYSLPKWELANTPWALALLIGLVFISSASALIACYKTLKEMPAETMRDKPAKSKGPIFLERFPGFWQSLSYEWQWTLRVAFRNKTRTIIGIIAIMGSIALFVDGFGLRDSLSNTNEKLYGHQFDYKSKIYLNEGPIPKEDRLKLYESVNDSSQWLWESTMDIRSSEGKSSGVIQIYDGGYFYHFPDKKGSIRDLPEGAIGISEKLAKDLGVGDDEWIQFRPLGQKEYLLAKVGVVYRISMPQGIFLSAASYEDMGGNFFPNILLTANPDVKEKLGGLDFVKKTISLAGEKGEAHKALGSILTIVIILIIGAVCLCIIVVYNLGNMGLLERSREYMTLRVMGYTDKEIRKIIRLDNQLQLILGLILGVPAGFALLKLHVALAASKTRDAFAYINPPNLLLIMVFVISLTLLISKIVGKKALSMDMIEALKSVE